MEKAIYVIKGKKISGKEFESELLAEEEMKKEMEKMNKIDAIGKIYILSSAKKYSANFLDVEI